MYVQRPIHLKVFVVRAVTMVTVSSSSQPKLSRFFRLWRILTGWFHIKKALRGSDRSESRKLTPYFQNNKQNNSEVAPHSTHKKNRHVLCPTKSGESNRTPGETISLIIDMFHFCNKLDIRFFAIFFSWRSSCSSDPLKPAHRKAISTKLPTA